MPGALCRGHQHVCLQMEGPKPHVGGPGGVPRVAVKSVQINGRPPLTVGDPVVCVGRPDKISSGISTVEFGGLQAADSLAPTDHGGIFVEVSSNVEIG
jgi:uncharacterized Zn-binding protein involved in type VI secretion